MSESPALAKGCFCVLELSLALTGFEHPRNKRGAPNLEPLVKLNGVFWTLAFDLLTTFGAGIVELSIKVSVVDPGSGESERCSLPILLSHL